MTSTVASYARELDRVPGDRADPQEPIDLASVVGEWSNTNRSTWGIVRATVIQHDSRLDLHIVAADPLGEPHDWGRATAQRMFTDGPGSRSCCGYITAFDLGHARVQLQTNINHGLTVIAAFTTFSDGSGRASYLSREFFHRLATQADSPWPPLGAGRATTQRATTQLAAARGDERLPMLRTSIDSGPLLCRWRNADQATRGVAEISCELRDDQLVIRTIAVGPAGPIDWGEVVATLHADISATGGGRAAADPVTDEGPTPHYANITATDAGPAFSATYDHGFQRVHLQARINLGVLVVGMFSEFTDDSGRADYFHREVFIREA